MISISIVVPVYSGERYLQKLVDAVEELRDQWTRSNAPIEVGELIFVDDGAVDGSPQLIDSLASKNNWVMSLHLSRNFGQHPATIAGILHTSGEWIVTLDEDLQHPPSRITDLLAAVSQTGCDVVYAHPESAVHEKALRDLGSRGFKRLIEWSTGNADIRKVNSFRLIRGSVARAASSVCGHDTYFDVALSWFTRRVETVTLPLKDERFIESKRSGYNLKRLLSHARRLLVSSHLKVLRIGALFGLAIVMLSVLGGTGLLAYKLVLPTAFAVQGWTSLMLAVAFFGGITVLMLGVILEYLSLLILRAHGKPLFFAIDRSSDAELARLIEISRK